MAYMSQERKATIKAELEKILLKSEGWGWSLSVDNHSTIVLTIRKGPLDFMGNTFERVNQIPGNQKYPKMPSYCRPNLYYLEREFSGACLKLMELVLAALNNGNWDKSDLMTDYFDVGWYVDINIGKSDSPYLYVLKKPARKPGKSYAKQIKEIPAKVQPQKVVPMSLELLSLLPEDYPYLTPIGKAWATRRAMKQLQAQGAV